MRAPDPKKARRLARLVLVIAAAIVCAPVVLIAIVAGARGERR